MTAKYEWRDETGLGHPSLVLLDITDVDESKCPLLEDILEQAPVLKVKQIESFGVMFSGGRLDLRKVRARGYEFLWHYKVMNRDHYALFVALVRKEVRDNNGNKNMS